jgi:hypothetical protein
MTVFLYTFTEREKIYNLIEKLTGARFTTSYTRIGGLARDLPPGFVDETKAFVAQFYEKIDELDNLLTRNRIFIDRNKDLGIISAKDAIDFGLTGPNLRGSGVDYDFWAMSSTNSMFLWDLWGIVSTATSAVWKSCAKARAFWSRRCTKFRLDPFKLPTPRITLRQKTQCLPRWKS